MLNILESYCYSKLEEDGYKVILTVCILSVLVFLTISIGNYRGEHIYIVSLLVTIPVVISLWALLFEYKRRSSVDINLRLHHVLSIGFVGNLSYTLVLTFYYTKWPSPGTSFIISIFILFLSIAFLCINSWIIILEFGDDSVYSDIREGMMLHPGISLSLFLSLFLSVILILSLSFAFYGSYYKDEVGGSALKTSESFVLDNDKDTTKTVGRVLFREGTAELKVDSSDDEIGSSSELEYTREGIIKMWNKYSFDYLCSKLRNLSTSKNNFKVRVIGHTSKFRPNISTDFENNYELGQARALQTMLYLFECISISRSRPRRTTEKLAGVSSSLQWTTESVGAIGKFRGNLANSIPFSKPNDSIIPTLKKDYEAKNQWPDTLKSAEIIIDELSPSTTTVGDLPVSRNSTKMDLLDYIYFTTYTITTTGYGDIRPSAPAMKAMTTLINLLEVLFIAIFFNLFLAFILSDTPLPNSNYSDKGNDNGDNRN